MIITKKSKRKNTGGLRTSVNRRNKTLAQKANAPILTSISSNDKEIRKSIRGKGGIVKSKAVAIKFVNLVDENGKTIKAIIKDVKANTANREYARRNIITKGADILVEAKGKTLNAKVTSRPGQHSVVNAVVKKE